MQDSRLHRLASFSQLRTLHGCSAPAQTVANMHACMDSTLPQELVAGNGLMSACSEGCAPVRCLIVLVLHLLSLATAHVQNKSLHLC